MRRVTDLIGLPVILVRGGAAIGTVTGVELDVVRGRICFLHLSAAADQDEIILPWRAVCTVDARTITVFTLPSRGDSLAGGGPLPHQPQMRVWGDHQSLHPIAGYEIDELSGRVTPVAQPLLPLIRDLEELMLDLGYADCEWLERDSPPDRERRPRAA